MNESPKPSEVQAFLEKAPDTEVVDLLVPDMNGVLRGKQLPVSGLEKIFKKGFNYPGSSELVDTKGQAIDTIPYGSADGDPDKIGHVVAGSLAPVPWAPRPTAQMLMSVFEPGGAPYYADPRHVLEKALAPLTDMGLKPVVAMELEFYLLDASKYPPEPAKAPVHLPAMTGAQVYHFDPLYDFHEFLKEIDDVCAAQNIPMSSTITEYGDGQFEINLTHIDDVMKACDDGLLLKRAVKGVARRHGLLATFMAKPFAEQVGNGLHVHMSLLDQKGNNVFAGEGSDFSEILRHAVGGLMVTMADAMAIFAPNANSYRRLQPGLYVPVTPNWGRNHRGVAVRLPVAEPEDARFEHRVASADANPYLVLAALLGGIHHGMTSKCDPGPMIEEGTILEDVVTLPVRWDDALNKFEASDVLPKYLGKDYSDVFVACRRCEEARFHSEISDRDYDWYLRTT